MSRDAKGSDGHGAPRDISDLSKPERQDAIGNMRADLFVMSTSAITDDTCSHRTRETVVAEPQARSGPGPALGDL